MFNVKIEAITRDLDIIPWCMGKWRPDIEILMITLPGKVILINKQGKIRTVTTRLLHQWSF